MGFIRGILIVLICILLFVNFLLMNTFLTFTLSLGYENVQEEVGPAIKEVVYENVDISNEVDKRLGQMGTYCESSNADNFVFSAEGYTFTVSCDSVSSGFDAILNESVESILEDAYYKEYDCGFWDCLEEEIPFFLVSEQAKDYWKNKFYLTLFIALAFITLIFFLVENKSNSPIIPGVLLGVSSLPFIKLGAFLSFSLDGLFFSFLGVFLSKSHTVFLISLISGIVLISIGIFMKLFSFGMGIFNKFNKNSKEKLDSKPQDSSGKTKSNFFKKLFGKGKRK